MRPTTRPNSRLLTVLLFSVVAAACSGGANPTAPAQANSNGELPIAASQTSELPIESLTKLANDSDAIIQGRLVEIVDAWRFPNDPEGAFEGVGDELVGLVFDVSATFAGKTDADRITVAWPSYTIDLDSRERVERNTINGINMSDPSPLSREFVLAVAFSAELDSYQVFSTKAFVVVEADGKVVNLSSSGSLKKIGIESVADLEGEAGLNR